MVYGCRCSIVDRSNRFMTSTEMRFFGSRYWQWTTTEKPSPTYVIRITTPHLLDLWAQSSGPWWWPQWHWAPCQWYASLCQVLTQSQNMHQTQKPSARPLVITWPNTHLCYEWNSYETHTTFPCRSLSSWFCYFLAASKDYPGSSHHGFSLFSMVWGHLSFALDSQIQSIIFSV